ncbi:hypothetical protein [Streptomyces nigrescens]|uniref:hypothetical protein n=1 Tax=Streptomyces nigrescens TaxID=1920 RepID=UPI00349664B0
MPSTGMARCIQEPARLVRCIQENRPGWCEPLRKAEPTRRSCDRRRYLLSDLRKDGPAVTFHQAPQQTFTNPLAIREVTSKQRLLPAIPKDLKVNKRPGDDI